MELQALASAESSLVSCCRGRNLAVMTSAAVGSIVAVILLLSRLGSPWVDWSGHCACNVSVCPVASARGTVAQNKTLWPFFSYTRTPSLAPIPKQDQIQENRSPLGKMVQNLYNSIASTELMSKAYLSEHPVDFAGLRIQQPTSKSPPHLPRLFLSQSRAGQQLQEHTPEHCYQNCNKPN